MDKDEAQAALESVRAAIHDKFEDEYGTHQGRLAAFDAALATAAMHVDHLHDEEDREIELAKRIVSRAQVHGGEVISPLGRRYEHSLAIAERG
jgi:hypothetical protein